MIQELDKIEKIFRMLSSTADGEVLNAVYAIRNILLQQNKNMSDLSNYLFSKAREFNYEDLIKERMKQAERDMQRENAKKQQEGYTKQKTPTERTVKHKNMCKFLIDMPLIMTTWESKFISDILERQLSKGYGLSDKQEACLDKIYNEYRRKSA